MKKTYIYILFGFLLAAILSFTIIKYNFGAGPDQYSLKERQGACAASTEWANTRKMAISLQNQIQLKPEDNKSRLALAAIFIKEARITGDHVYYDKAAMKYVNDALAKEPRNFDALLYKSLLFLSQHHFAEGLKTAEEARNLNPHNAFVYGILVDAHVELGNYALAVENSDKMVSIRPDIRSYSRISYLREIHGDYPGAIEAMIMAIQAGVPGDETTEWARVQLGQLYEKTGDLKSAEMHYMIALEQRPDYASALAGLGRISISKNEFYKAIDFYLKADSQTNDYAIEEELVDAYQISNQDAKARTLAKRIIYAMNEDARDGENDESIGHYVDQELAHAYLQINDYDNAVKHALMEYNRRPENIGVNETLAWAYYNKGEYQKALPYLKNAMKTNSKNPTLLCRAGLIYSAVGEKQLAKSLLDQGLEKKPNISKSLETDAINKSKSL